MRLEKRIELNITFLQCKGRLYNQCFVVLFFVKVIVDSFVFSCAMVSWSLIFIYQLTVHRWSYSNTMQYGCGG